jgi:hypothetical protein
MAVTINASLTNGLVQTADTSGDLSLQSGGTTILAITSTGATIQGLTVGKGGGAGAYNTALGVSALAATATGVENTGIGYYALKAVTSGQTNTAVGAYSGYQITTGYANTSLGDSSLQSNVSGNANTAIGNTSLSSSTGSYNTALGTESLKSNTTASNNTAVGYQAGYTNITGAQNVLLGTRAGYLGTNTSYKVMMGYEAGYSSSFSGDSFNTFIGTQAGYFITSGIKNTILGGYNGNQGSLDIRTASNYIVLSDGDGNPLVSTNSTSSVALNGATPKTGTGITFPATQSASTDANTLDDYEEGTWTATMVWATQGSGSGNVTGVYTKIGNVVHLRAYPQPVKGSASGNFSITGIPFVASENTAVSLRCDAMGAVSTVVQAALVAASSKIEFTLMNQSTAYGAIVTAAQMAATCYINIQCTYQI